MMGYDWPNVMPSASTTGMQGEEKQTICLMGLPKSGKTSIKKVVFENACPSETINYEATNQLAREDISNRSFLKYNVYDIPGQMNPVNDMYQNIFSGHCAIIYVIDAKLDYMQALQSLASFINHGYRIYPSLQIEVFIHKVDCLQDDRKIEVQRDITQRMSSMIGDIMFDLQNAGLCAAYQQPIIGYHLTTIFDHSIFEAFSKVVQKMIPNLEIYEQMLNIFTASSNLDKAFLLDIATKIYLATDSSIVDMQTYELCCDMINVALEVTKIYSTRPPAVGGEDQPAVGATRCITSRQNSDQDASRSLHEHQIQQQQQQPPPPQQMGPSTDMTSSAAAVSSSFLGDESCAKIRLNNETVLLLRSVNRYIVLVCLMRDESTDHMGLIEYNFQIVRNGLLRLLTFNQERLQANRQALLLQQKEQQAHSGCRRDEELAGQYDEDDEEEVGIVNGLTVAGHTHHDSGILKFDSIGRFDNPNDTAHVVQVSGFPIHNGVANDRTDIL